MKWAAGGRSQGFTIVETLIVLAVTGALFLSAVAFISGRQQQTEFKVSVRNFESILNDIANDVSDGYFANYADSQLVSGCTATAVSITVTAGADDNSGSKNDCILIGKALQFAPSGSDGQAYNTVSLVGRHYINANANAGDVTSYLESGVKAIAPTDPSTPNGVVTERIFNGVRIACAFYINPVGSPATVPPATSPCALTGTNVKRIDVLAFMTKLQGLDINNNQETGSTSVDVLVPAAATTLNRTAVSAANTVNGFSVATNAVKNPAGGIFICLQSGGTTQHALVKMGGSNSGFSALSKIESGDC